MLAPRRCASAAVANTYMPVVLVSADAQPIRADAPSATANASADASTAHDSASRSPAPVSPTVGTTASARRPAGRSVSSRPSPNAVVSRPISPAVSDRSLPMSGSSGIRAKAATATAKMIVATTAIEGSPRGLGIERTVGDLPRRREIAPTGSIR